MGFRLRRMDLLTLSHTELIALVEQQQALIAELQATVTTQAATIARLEQRLRTLEGGDGPARGMPGHKRQQPDQPPPRPRRKRALQFTRVRGTPTAHVTHAATHCPDCGTALGGGSVKRTREVIEVTPSPAVVTEHRYLERCCPGCGRRVTPAVDLSGMVAGQSRLGVGLVSLIATLRGEWRMPIRAIQQALGSVHDLRLSVGAIHGALGQVARVGQSMVADTLASIRASPVVHADETGWREGGRNCYLWTFSTPTHCYYRSGSREKGMVDTVLGPDFSGVLVSDFYAAYDHYDGVQQKCWVHLLRDIHHLTRQHPADAALAAWATDVRAVYDDALAAAAGLTAQGASEAARRTERQALEERLWAVCEPFAADEDAPQAVLCRRVDKYRHALFSFVREAGVPSHNNAAERSVRHEVVGRKISGGTRSEAGTRVRTTLATLFGTWRLQGLDPYQACLALLTSPQG
jgi:transposase